MIDIHKDFNTDIKVKNIKQEMHTSYSITKEQINDTVKPV